METQSSKLGIPAFLFIVVSLTEMPYYVKYPLLTVAFISLLVAIHGFHKTIKARINKKIR